MPKPSLQLDKKALGKLLVTEYSDDIARVTNEVAKTIDRDVNILVGTGINRAGRPYGLVTIAEPQGLALQAKHGVLTRAAAQCGLDIKRTEAG